MVSERQINKLPDCLLSNDPTADQPYRPTHAPFHLPDQQAEAMTNSSRTPQTKEGVDHHLWGDWTFIKTSLLPSLNWHLDSKYFSLALTWQRTNSSQLTQEKSRVHRRWASCLNHKIKANHCCTRRWHQSAHNVQPAGTDVGSKLRQDYQWAKCYARVDPDCTQTAFQLTWYFRKTFLLAQ